MASWVRIAVVLLAFIDPAGAADSFVDFQATYRCDVLRRLEQIYATGDPGSDLNRYIVITVPANESAYVQSRFRDSRGRVHCEASSGFWSAKKGQPRRFHLPPHAVTALAKLGFDPDDSAGNFIIDRVVDKSADFHPLADLMLRALHGGYGARSTMKLQFKAPFAPVTPAACIPVS
jgi:hypothetical protein